MKIPNSGCIDHVTSQNLFNFFSDCKFGMISWISILNSLHLFCIHDFVAKKIAHFETLDPECCTY